MKRILFCEKLDIFLGKFGKISPSFSRKLVLRCLQGGIKALALSQSKKSKKYTSVTKLQKLFDDLPSMKKLKKKPKTTDRKVSTNSLNRRMNVLKHGSATFSDRLRKLNNLPQHPIIEFTKKKLDNYLHSFMNKKYDAYLTKMNNRIDNCCGENPKTPRAPRKPRKTKPKSPSPKIPSKSPTKTRTGRVVKPKEYIEYR